MGENQELFLKKDALELIQATQESKNIETKIKQAISFIGNENKYQILLIVYFSLCFVLATSLLLGNTYYFMNPSFICEGKTVTEEEACKNLPDCTIENDYTITYEAELYCEKATERNLIQSMLGIGACLGVLFVNAISDYKGRKFSLILSMVIGIIGVSLLIIGTYAKITTFLVISQIMAGFSANSILTLVYVLSDKLMSKNYCNKSILITNGVFGLTEVGIMVFTLGIFDWRHYSIIVTLIPAVGTTILGLFFLVEDPVILLTKKRYQQCRQSLETIATFNKTQSQLIYAYSIVTQLESNINLKIDQEDISAIAKKLKYLKLLKKKQIIIPIICLGLYMIGGNCTLYIQSYSISQTGYSFGLSIALFGFFQFVGVIPMLLAGQKMKRKFWSIILVTVQIVLSLLFIFGLSKMLQTIFIVFTRMLGVTCYALYVLIIVETFPHHIQSTSFGIIEFIAQFGKILAPFAVRLSDNLDISPIFTAGILMLVFCLLTLLPLKQTLLVQKQHEHSVLSTQQTENN